jgi:hypothetical protein
MFTRSVSPEQAPDKPTYLEIDFEKGDPVALNGEKLSPATLLAQLNKVGMQIQTLWPAANLLKSHLLPEALAWETCLGIAELLGITSAATLVIVLQSL